MQAPRPSRPRHTSPPPALLAFACAGLALPPSSPAQPQQRPTQKTVLTSAPQKPLPIALVQTLPACTAAQILLSTDEEGGNFNGMSHSGTLLVLRNMGTSACRLLPLAQASLLDGSGTPLGPFTTASPGARFLHPGPVVLPIAVAANAELTATLRWVSGPVFNDSLCLAPATLVLKLGDLTLKTPLQGSLCGERTDGVSAELSRFAPDPVVQSR